MATTNLEVYDHNLSYRVEQAQHKLELPPLTTGEQALRDAILLPETIRAPLLTQFDSAIQSELDTCINPADQRLILGVASIIRWHWFAQPGESIPTGTIMREDDLELCDSSLEAKHLHARNYLLRNCLMEVNKIRNDTISNHQTPQIEKALLIIAKEQPIYQLLHAVAADTPKQQDLPLTLAERMIRETQEEHDVRQKHGLARDASLRMHPDAHARLQKQLHQLDEETRPRPAAKHSDARSRLLGFVLDVFNTVGDGIGGEPIAKLCLNDNGCLTGVAPSGTSQDIDHTACDWALDFASTLSVGTITENYTNSQFLIHSLAYELAYNTRAYVSGMELLEKAVAGSLDVNIYGLGGVNAIPANIHAHLLGIDAPIVKHRTIANRIWSKSIGQPSAEVMSAESLAYNKSRPIGRVYETNPFQYNQTTAGRLIMPSSIHAELPTSLGAYDFMLALDNRAVLPGGHVPFIPGYELVGHQGECWFFEHINPDPYSGVDQVILETTQLQQLLQEFKATGLVTLADRLDDVGELSLKGLVDNLRDVSDYTFDPARALLHDADELDFGQLVDSDGRLQVQCTGAAAFLCQVLKTALPDSKAVPISGMPIQRNGLVSRVGHAQVMLAHHGRQYILDATPSSEFVESTPMPYTTEDMFPTDTSQTHQTEQPTQMKPDDVQIVTTTAQQHRKQREKQAENVLDRTKQQLKGHFNLPLTATDDKLYEQVVRLKKDADPIRRVLELVLQHQAGQNISYRLDREKQYLMNLIDADAHLSRRIGVPHYTPTLLGTLIHTIDDLEIISR